MTALLPKPLYGDPCNSCGLCCFRSQCPISEIIFGEVAVCPAIEATGPKTFGCGIMLNPARYVSMAGQTPESISAGAKAILGAGSGCDAVDNAEDEALHRADPELFVRRLNEMWPSVSAEARGFIVALGGTPPE